MAWVGQWPFNDAASGTTPGSVAPLSTADGAASLTMTVGSGAAWNSGAAGRRFDVQDNIAPSWVGGTAINAWFHGSTSITMEAIVNDTLAANKTWFEFTGTTGLASITYHGFGLNVSTAGVVSVIMNIPGTGPTAVLVSSAAAVTANVDTYVVVVFDSSNATADDRIRLYINGSRVTPASPITDPGEDLALVWNHASNAAIWVGGGTASAATINNYVAWLGAATHAATDAEVADRWTLLAVGNDADPLDGTPYPVAAGAGVTGTGTLAVPQVAADAGTRAFLDVLVRNGSGQDPDTPSGWTLIAGPHTGTGGTMRRWVFRENSNRTGSESGDLSVTFAAGSSRKTARMYAVANDSGAAVEDVDVALSTDTPASMPAVTADGTRRLAMAFIATDDDVTIAAATGMSGGTWSEAFAEYLGSTNTMLQLQTASLGGGGTVTGGSAVMSGTADVIASSFAIVGIDPSGGGAQDLEPSAFAGSAGIQAPTVNHGVLASAYAGLAVLEEPAVTTGPTSLSPSSFVGTSTTPEPTLTTLTSLSPSEFDGASDFGAPTITIFLTPGSLAGLAVLEEPTVTTGPVTLSPGAHAGLAVLEEPTVTTGPVTVSPTAFGSAAGIEEPALHLELLASEQPGLAVLEEPTMTPGAVVLEPGAHAEAAGIEEPTVSAFGSLEPSELNGSAGIAPPVVANEGTTLLQPSAFSGAAVLEEPAVTPGAVVVAPDALAGAASLQVPDVDLIVLPSNASFSAGFDPPSISSSIGISPPIFDGLAILEEPAVTTGVVTLEPSSLDGAAVIPTPSIGLMLAPSGFAGTAIVQGPVVAVGDPVLAPGSFVGTAIFGAASIALVFEPEIAIIRIRIRPLGEINVRLLKQ